MKLYTRHSKPIPVASSGQPEGIDVSACRSDDARSATVVVINSKFEPVELRLDLSGYGDAFAPKSRRTVCDTFDRRQIDAANHWTAPDVIRTADVPVSGGTITLRAYSVSVVQCRPRK